MITLFFYSWFGASMLIVLYFMLAMAMDARVASVLVELLAQPAIRFHAWMRNSPRFMLSVNAVGVLMWVFNLTYAASHSHWVRFALAIFGLILNGLGVWAWGSKLRRDRNGSFKAVMDAAKEALKP